MRSVAKAKSSTAEMIRQKATKVTGTYDRTIFMNDVVHENRTLQKLRVFIYAL